jgi:hypothetical protein
MSGLCAGCKARRFVGRALLGLWLALGAPGAGPAPFLATALADDDDDNASPGPSPSGPSPSGPSGGASSSGGPGGGASGGEGAVRGFDLGPNPGTNPFRDAGRAMRALFGAAPPAATPPLPNTIRAEFVARGLPEASLAALIGEGYSVEARRTLGTRSLTRLLGPPGVPVGTALARLRGAAPQVTADINHRYRPAAAEAWSVRQIAWPEPASCAAVPRLALVDTRLDRRHPGLAGAAIEARTVRAPDRSASGSRHATALALLLVGQAPTPGLLPGARLLAIDAFHRDAEGDAADAYDIAGGVEAAALAGARVVLLAFAGPRNLVVEEVGAEAARRAVFIAAAGNGGPGAPRQFPAASPWALAATAVDREERVYAQAARGGHIAFAAPGVALSLPVGPGGQPRSLSGTSFAAAFVAAAAAASGEASVAGVVARLAPAARDLGAPGRDPVFGHGLVQAAALCAG